MMYAYSMPQWLAFFYIYCIFGWCFESAYVSLKEHHPVNRGFMTGPYIPLYGSGAVLILFVTLPVRGNYILMYIVGAVAATILEYFTGVIMERLFGVRYWDYSDQKFNFQGQVCLSSTIVWGFMTLFLVEVIHHPIEQVVLLIDEKVLTNITMAFTVVFTFDFASAFRTAIDLRDVLIQAEKAKKEFELMQKRVEVLEAVLNDSVENMVEGFNDSVENVVEDFNNRVNERKLRRSEAMEERMAELAVHMERLRNRLESSEGIERLHKALEDSKLNDRMEDLQTEMKRMGSKLEGLRFGAGENIHPRQLHMLHRNPSAKSVRYKEGWQYLKDKIKRYEEENRRN
ncbi:MAG: hypothetical protein ACI4BB_08670 [Coprococcus sp.]